MSYKIVLTETAKSNLKELDKGTIQRISKKLQQIKDNPFLFVKRLTGVPLFSLRVGDYRILMDIKADKMLILIVRIGHRKSIYDKR